FTEPGIRIAPAASSRPSWEWGVALRRYGREGNLRAAHAAPIAPAGRRAERHWPGLDERDLNGETGFEQVFALASRPHRTGNGDVILEASLTGTLAAQAGDDGRSFTFSSEGVAVLRYGDLRVTDASGVSLPARLEGNAEGTESLMQIRFQDDGAA